MLSCDWMINTPLKLSRKELFIVHCFIGTGIEIQFTLVLVVDLIVAAVLLLLTSSSFHDSINYHTIIDQAFPSLVWVNSRLLFVILKFKILRLDEGVEVVFLDWIVIGAVLLVVAHALSRDCVCKWMTWSLLVRFGVVLVELLRLELFYSLIACIGLGSRDFNLFECRMRELLLVFALVLLELSLGEWRAIIIDHLAKLRSTLDILGCSINPLLIRRLLTLLLFPSKNSGCSVWIEFLVKALYT